MYKIYFVLEVAHDKVVSGVLAIFFNFTSLLYTVFIQNIYRVPMSFPFSPVYFYAFAIFSISYHVVISIIFNNL